MMIKIDRCPKSNAQSACYYQNYHIRRYRKLANLASKTRMEGRYDTR